MTGPQKAGAATPQPGPSLVTWAVAGAVLTAVAGGGIWLVAGVQAAAREAPNVAACQRNLRSIGQAVRMYAQDHDDRLPSTAAGRGDVTGLLEPYSRQRHGQGIWRCPSQQPFASGIWTSSYGYNWQYLLEPGPDYPHNGWNGIEKPGFQVSMIARPAGTLMFVDHKPPPGNPTPQLWSYVVRPSQKIKDPYELDGMGQVDRRHAGKANVLFCDGHVKLMGAEVTDEREYWRPR